MALSNKLINPTPFPVEYKYEKGVVLKIPADGELELTVSQLDDFIPNKPGSEEVRKILGFHGLFLQDVDKSYDSQALAALKECVKIRKGQYREFVDRLRKAYIEQGKPADDETVEEQAALTGYKKFNDDIGVLENRIKALTTVVDKDKTKGRLKEDLDPERTTFVTTPPRQFPSKTALKMFLDENPSLKREHNKMYREMFTQPKEKVTNDKSA